MEAALVTETAVSGSSEITDNRKQSLSLQTQLDSALVEVQPLHTQLK